MVTAIGEIRRVNSEPQVTPTYNYYMVEVSCHQAVIQAVTAVTQGIFRLDGRCRPVKEVWIGLGAIGSVITLSCCLGCFLRWRLRT